MTERAQVFVYVWEPYVEVWHRAGWMLTNNATPIYDGPRGEHLTYLMQWPCDCPLQFPAQRTAYHDPA